MAPSTNFSIRHEYAKVRSPRRITSNGWDRSELLMKKPGDESNAEGEEVEFLMKRSSTGNLHARICANCRTSKTPLWRSGPTGPKSLCNACGIRFRKKQQEAGSNKDTLTLFSLSGVVTSPGGDAASENVLTLEEMKAQQKAKQERHLRFIAKRLVQERRRRQLEVSRREILQAAQLLVSLSKGATPSS